MGVRQLVPATGVSQTRQPGNRQPAMDDHVTCISLWLFQSVMCSVTDGSKRGNLGRKGNEGKCCNPLSLSYTFRSKFDQRQTRLPRRVFGYHKIFAAHMWTFLLWTELRGCPRSQIYSAPGVRLSSTKKSSYFWRGRNLDHRFILIFSSL